MNFELVGKAVVRHVHKACDDLMAAKKDKPFFIEDRTYALTAA